MDSDHRASQFRRVCQRVSIPKGVTLHGYRYAWAQRAYSAGMPEREAMAHLGHGSRAVHRSYARGAQVVTQSLEAYEQLKAEQMCKIIAFQPEAETAKRHRQNLQY